MNDLTQPIRDLALVLSELGLKVVTVESCTGGWIGKSLTDFAGSSSWFAGGLITYSNESKQSLAGVPLELLVEFGAVSEQVAEAMARGALAHFDQAVSIAVTGIAGPDGGSSQKPVGTVCIASCVKGVVSSARYQFKGDRDQVRAQSVEMAVSQLLLALQSAE